MLRSAAFFGLISVAFGEQLNTEISEPSLSVFAYSVLPIDSRRLTKQEKGPLLEFKVHCR